MIEKTGFGESSMIFHIRGLPNMANYYFPIYFTEYGRIYHIWISANMAHYPLPPSTLTIRRVFYGQIYEGAVLTKRSPSKEEGDRGKTFTGSKKPRYNISDVIFIDKTFKSSEKLIILIPVTKSCVYVLNFCFFENFCLNILKMRVFGAQNSS